jgi:glycosyltransferase involved in cell wall biosynthesis
LARGIASKHSKSFEVQDHGGFFDGEVADEPLWPLRSRLAWRIARRAKLIRTVSPKSLENLRAKGLGDKAYWLPISADPRFSSLARRPKAGLVVSVGRLVSVKRFPILLESMMELKKFLPESRLAIIGDGPSRQALEAMAARLGIKEAVDFVGQADPAPWLERAAVFALLSSHEGWGVAAVEAASAGVPVVMSDTGCARWLAERGAATVIGRGAETPKNIALRLSAAMASGPLEASAPVQPLDARQTAVEQVKAWSRIL